MITNEYHILNGDALKAQLPQNIIGTIIVARECLVDGDVKANNLDELFQIRAQFISQHYLGYTQQMYREKTIPEFEKIQQIPEASCINLWFEDDLFCQVNFWFVVYLIQQSGRKYEIFLIRPDIHDSYGFGGLNHKGLNTIFSKKNLLKNANQIALLWKYYQHNVTVHLVRKMV